jgi:protein TonB
LPEPAPITKPAESPLETPKIDKPKIEKIRPVEHKHTEPKANPKPARTAAKPSEDRQASKASPMPATEPSIKAPAEPVAPAPAPEPAPSAESKQELLAAYQAALAAAIEREKFYPVLARRLNQEGIVEIGFTVQADGRIVNIHLLSQAPSAVLERGAMEAIARVGQFQPIPPKLGMSAMNLTISLVYKLR